MFICVGSITDIITIQGHVSNVKNLWICYVCFLRSISLLYTYKQTLIYTIYPFALSFIFNLFMMFQLEFLHANCAILSSLLVVPIHIHIGIVHDKVISHNKRNDNSTFFSVFWYIFSLYRCIVGNKIETEIILFSCFHDWYFWFKCC